MKRRAKTHTLAPAFVISLALTGLASLRAQTKNANPVLPDAPSRPLVSVASVQQAVTAIAPGQSAPAAVNDRGGAQHPRLTRAEAEQMAIKNNPRVSIGRLLALAQHQVVRETRAAQLPTATGSITAMDAKDGSRISAGSLTASRLIEHAGAGGNFTQLITDFGKTSNLVASSKLLEKARNASALATTEDIVIATDQAFYNALEAQALVKVAQQNVDTRQTTQTQVNQMTQNNLKSTLDLSFANVN